LNNALDVRHLDVSIVNIGKCQYNKVECIGRKYILKERYKAEVKHGLG
jgi:hypothetical protein